MKYDDQRVGLFVDVSNLYYSAKVMYETKVNFKELMDEAVSGRKLVRAIAYVIKADNPDEQKFFEALEDFGFQVKMKELQVFKGGQKKADWDVGIAMDTIRLADKLDVVVLASGDGDYAPLVRHLQSKGVQVEVAAFGRSTSNKLLEAAEDFIDLDKDDKFLLD